MKIGIELEATYNFDIDVTDEILFDVVSNYNGDIKAWAKDNYNEYYDSSDMEIDSYRCSFDKEEAETAISKATEELIAYGDTNREIIDGQRLKCSIIPSVNPELLELFEIDAFLLSQVLPFVDTENPKQELNYIHLKDNIVEATDTKRLIRINNHKFNCPDICFPTYFIQPLMQGAELYILRSDNSVFLKFNETWHSGIDFEPRYVDTNRILIADIDKSDIPKMMMQDLHTEIIRIDDIEEIIEIVFNEQKYKFGKLYWEDIVKLNPQFIATYSDRLNPTSQVLPFFFFGGENDIQMVLMPLFD